MKRIEWNKRKQLRVGVIRHFHASHWLNNYEGNCANVHGHTWKVKVVVQGEKLNKYGMIIDFRDLKKKVDEIIKEFDHNIVNFVVEQPTAENLARYIFFRMKEWTDYLWKRKTGIKYCPVKVVVYETENSYAEYTYDDWFEEMKERMRKKSSERLKKYWEECREEHIQKLREAFSKETVRILRSERMKRNNPMFIRKNVEKMLKSLKRSLKIKPNKVERKFIEFCKKYGLNYKYVGDLSFFVDGKNPDFVDMENRRIIEIFGRFWHSDNNLWYETKNDEEERKKFFEERGWKCLIIWDDELEDEKSLLKKIKEFEKSGDKVEKDEEKVKGK